MGEIESRKEFIARMFLLTQEIPEHKRNDLNIMLGFFSIQLRHREMEFAKYAVKRVLSGLSNKRILSSRERAKILDMFEAAFSETDYLFEPITQREREEFLLDKAKQKKDVKKNTEGFLYGLKHTDPNKTNAGKKRLKEAEESNKQGVS